jgi:putative ABC transport system permease protein
MSAATTGQRGSVLVAALSSAFGVLLLEVTGVLDTIFRASDIGGRAQLVVALTVVSVVFISIAVYVGAIVTVNTVATVIAGRTTTIALYRLIGSSAQQQRRKVAREGLSNGFFGATVGAVVGVGLAIATVGILEGTSLLPGLDYEFLRPAVAFPFVVVVLTTWLASWIGSRSVLQVAPVQAVSAAQERGFEESRSGWGRRVLAIVLGIVGLALLAFGIVVSFTDQLGLLISMLGGMISFTGFVLGAVLFMPSALAAVGKFAGASAPASLAAKNARRYPERSTRMTVGLVIGVTLITMFAVAAQTFDDTARRATQADPSLYAGVSEQLAIAVAVFSVLIGFSAVIAAVGLINNLSLSVLQRRRELGLLRALGLTGSQVRRMIVVEAALYAVAAVSVGLVLGIGYGWAGAQSLLGSAPGVHGVVPPSVPWQLVVIVAMTATLLTVVASVLPARRATRIVPVEALAVD